MTIAYDVHEGLAIADPADTRDIPEVAARYGPWTAHYCYVSGAARMVRSTLRVLAAELAGLSEQDRDVLLLTSWAGLEPAEVAEALGVPASTVRSRLHRVRHRLQALLVPTEENPS